MLYPGNFGRNGGALFSSCPLFFFLEPPLAARLSARQSNSATTGPSVAVSSRTASASFFNLVPQQVLHGISDIYPCSRVFTNSLSVFSNRRSRFGITPSHHVPVPKSPFLSVPYIKICCTFFGISLYGCSYLIPKS